MTTNYNFLSGKEPSDEQLHELMKAVLHDVKIRSSQAQKKFDKLQKKQILEAKDRFRKRHFVDEQK